MTDHASKSPPTTMPTATQVRLRLADVPREKWQDMVARTILGLIFILLGIAMLVFMWIIFDRTEQLSEMLLIGGVTIFGFGWKTVSGQLVDRQVEQFVRPLRAVVDVFRRGGP
jgi:uncharacterized membrane protein